MITTEIEDRPRQRRHSLLPASFGESLSAAYEEGAVLGRPADAISRRREEERLKGEGDDYLGMLPIQSPQVDVGRIISAREANRLYQPLGLNFDAPIPEKLANLRARKKQAEIRRQDILARGPAGVLPATAQFGAMFVSALMDPINIAASFVPVVGQSRYAAMIARLGTTKARASRGAIEGVVGNTLVEPFIFSQAKREQLDYTMTDALVNVAFGGLIGGGLHVGGGKLADIAKARAEAGLAKADARAEIRSAVNEVSNYVDAQTPEARVAALRTSIAQVIGDKRVNVAPVFNATQARTSGSAGVRSIEDPLAPHLRTLAEEKGYDSATIAELHERVGGDLEDLKETLRRGSQEGRYVLDKGDASLLTPQERAAAVDIGGAPHYRVRLGSDSQERGSPVGAGAERTLDDKVLEAANEATGGQVARVSLATIREQFPDVSREEMDALLKKMQADEKIVLYPNNDPRSITPADEQAALDILGAKRHFLYAKRASSPPQTKTRPSKAEQKRIVESEEDIDDTPRPREMEETEDVETQRQRAEQEGLDDLLAQAEAEGLDVSTLTKEVDEMEAEYNKAVDEAVRCTIGR